jgi:hypothetical protein
VESTSIWRDWLNVYTLKVLSTSKSSGLIMAEIITRPLGSLYCLVLLDLLFLLLFLELVFNKKPLKDLLRALLDVKFYPLLVSSCLRLF